MVPSLLCTFVVHITFLHVSFLPTPLSFSPSPSLSLSLSLSLSPPSFSVWLQDKCHLMPFTKYSLLDQSYLFHTISFHSLNKIHQLFTDYLLQLPSSELLEKHLFRSRANRRLVDVVKFKNLRSLAELLCFGCCQVQKMKKSRRIVSFWMLLRSKIKEVSQNCLVFKFADR